jgi:hypothetical protein
MSKETMHKVGTEAARLDLRSLQRAEWLTTGDAARMLGVSRWGVRWLVLEAKQLVAARTRSGQWLFRRGDVLRLVEQRALARVRTRAEVWASLRVLRSTAEPRQLLLPFQGAVRRSAAHRSWSETQAIPEQNERGPIIAAMLPRARMARVEGSTNGTHRAAGGRRA